MATRAEDERLLRWLAQRQAGRRAADIALGAGLSVQRVSTATNRVAQADIEHAADEPADEFRRAYPWMA